MDIITLKMKVAFAFLIGGILAAGPVMADKPSWAGGGKGDKEDRMERRDQDHPPAVKSGHFEDRHRVVVRDYYAKQLRKGHCPPGLAKKHNGCMPPGQAKKWQIGQPLPHDVTYYKVPQKLVVQIGVPPSGYRYVRVANDILMIATGTKMVVDAIQDINK